jgi:tetratricopeptide (TPR) repeat protein
MKSNSLEVRIFCGEAGVGKTTLAMTQWSKHLMIKGSDVRNQHTTMSALVNALADLLGKYYDTDNEIFYDLRNILKDGYTIIFDQAEQIDAMVLKTVINTAISANQVILVFTFDLNQQALFENRMFRLLLDADIVPQRIENIIAKPEELNRVILDKLSDAGKEMIDKLQVLCGGNFRHLNRLLWLVKNNQNDYNSVTDSVVTTYFHSIVDDMFHDLPPELFKVFKQFSIIGKMFQRCVLESPDGFCIVGVRTYLDKLEAMNVLTHKYFESEFYEFNPDGMHDGVLACIEPHERVEWEQILLRYYKIKLKMEQVNEQRMEYLYQIKRLVCSLNDQRSLFGINRHLLYLYMKRGDLQKALAISGEMLQYCKDETDGRQLLRLLAFQNAKLNIQLWHHNDAFAALELIQKFYSNDGGLYLMYYRALCLYNCDQTDKAYKESSTLVARLRTTSSKPVKNQPIYALAYSLLATIQHHLHIKDDGARYYTKALNHAKKKIEDKSVYYTILKKCDMYYDYCFSKPLLFECISYFKGKSHLIVAETYMNLGTEMMFNDKDTFHEVQQYFKWAIAIFENEPNECLSYIRNNFAIYHILSCGDIATAMGLLERALLVDITPFTSMTIFLNLSMCRLKQYGYNDVRFQETYNEFMKQYAKIKQQKYATQYGDIYKTLLDLIVLEHSGRYNEAHTISQALLAGKVNPFFIPILNDIIRRTGTEMLMTTHYSDNSVFYERLNDDRLFLAEFRFWE